MNRFKIVQGGIVRIQTKKSVISSVKNPTKTVPIGQQIDSYRLYIFIIPFTNRRKFHLS